MPTHDTLYATWNITLRIFDISNLSPAKSSGTAINKRYGVVLGHTVNKDRFWLESCQPPAVLPLDAPCDIPYYISGLEFVLNLPVNQKQSKDFRYFRHAWRSKFVTRYDHI